MDKKIIFQKFNFNYIYFILYIAIYFASYFLKFFDIKNYVFEALVFYLSSYQLIYIYINFVSNFIALIPFLIIKIKTKKNKNIDNENKERDDLSLIYNKFEKYETKKIIKKNILYFFLLALFDFLSQCVNFIFNILYSDESNYIGSLICTVPFYIIIQYALSYFTLKMNFYKIHYFSFILNSVIFIILIILDILDIIANVYRIKYYFFYLLILTFDSYEYCLGKKLLTSGFITPYNLLLIKAIFNFGIILIFSIIILIIDKNIFIGIGFYFTEIESIFMKISNIFIIFLKNLFLWIIIDRFSPNHFPLALILKEIIGFILDITVFQTGYSDKIWVIVIRIILYIILFIGVMIHNEIVIINICGLGSYTKYFLDLKAIKEQIYSNEENPEILKRYETFEENDDHLAE